MTPEEMEHMNVSVAKDLASQRRELETLRAENEALKADMEDLRRANLSMLESHKAKKS